MRFNNMKIEFLKPAIDKIVKTSIIEISALAAAGGVLIWSGYKTCRYC